MGVKEIRESLDKESDMDLELKNDILNKVLSINKACKIIDNVNNSLKNNKEKFNAEEYKYIEKKFMSYNLLFDMFSDGKIVDYNEICDISNRIFKLEEGINNNDINVWKNEFMSLKNSEQDNLENEKINNMLMVVDDNSFFTNVTNFFNKIKWKIKNKGD